MLNNIIVNKMKSVHEEFSGMPIGDIKSLINQGMKIIEEDEKAADAGFIRSHYHLSEQEQLAMTAASLYNIHAEDPGEEE